MTYDITMCADSRCPFAEQCRRQLTYRQYQTDTDPRKPLYVPMFNSGRDGRRCEFFMDITK